MTHSQQAVAHNRKEAAAAAAADSWKEATACGWKEATCSWKELDLEEMTGMEWAMAAQIAAEESGSWVLDSAWWCARSSTITSTSAAKVS